MVTRTVNLLIKNFQVRRSINYIVHNDLHLGNVLVVWVDKALKAVIHDFDKSVYSTDVDRRRHDTETFLSHFEEAMNINI